MSLEEWDERYRAGAQSFVEPSQLIVDFTRKLVPGAALDVACGPGRNSLCLAEQGWRVTAVDGSPLAIEILRERASKRNVSIDARVADLERDEFQIAPEAFDLVLDCYYLQRDLIPAVKSGVRPGGTAIVIVHLAEPDHPCSLKRAQPGELRGYFRDWNILHYYEGPSREACHQRPVAELVAQNSRC